MFHYILRFQERKLSKKEYKKREVKYFKHRKGSNVYSKEIKINNQILKTDIVYVSFSKKDFLSFERNKNFEIIEDRIREILFKRYSDFLNKENNSIFSSSIQLVEGSLNNKYNASLKRGSSVSRSEKIKGIDSGYNRDFIETKIFEAIENLENKYQTLYAIEEASKISDSLRKVKKQNKELKKLNLKINKSEYKKFDKQIKELSTMKKEIKKKHIKSLDKLIKERLSIIKKKAKKK